MGTRITNLQTTDVLINQIFNRRTDLETIRQQIASGTKVQVSSDDTGKAGTILNLQSIITRVDRHKERISLVTSQLEHQQSTLSTADSILVRAKELATQAANGSLSYQDRALLGDEVFQIRDQLVALANTKYQGRYVYGGNDDGTQPFTASTYTQSPTNTSDPAYSRYVYNTSAGAQATRTVDISDDTSVKVNTPGDDIFQNSISALERLGRSLKGYRTTLGGTGLPNGLGTAYTQPADFAEQTHDIITAMDALDSARTNDIIVEESDLGARLNRIDQVSSILDNLKTSTETSRASLQDTDIFEASAKFSNLQSSLQALLASGSQINSLSLLNYL
ncbi:MAG: flagellar hook-associated protein FlgL [Bdellovibrionota bacterium]